MRLRLDVAYDGREFHGWARQPGLRTVQGELETWLTRLLRLDPPAELVVAGRTDAGVHARGQVAHLDVPDVHVPAPAPEVPAPEVRSSGPTPVPEVRSEAEPRRAGETTGLRDARSSLLSHREGRSDDPTPVPEVRSVGPTPVPEVRSEAEPRRAGHGLRDAPSSLLSHREAPGNEPTPVPEVRSEASLEGPPEGLRDAPPSLLSHRGTVPEVRSEADVIATDLERRLRRVLPDDIIVRRVSVAPDGFDARFSAAWRRYTYRVASADDALDPLLRGHVVTVRHDIDVDELNRVAPLLIGLRDFAPFCKPRDGATTIRELRELRATRRDDGVVEIHLLADAFCHSMVRSLVGALLAVAGGQREPEWLERVAAHPQRHNEVVVMPAHGLVLEEVGYPADELLAARAAEARAVRTITDGGRA